MGIKVAILIFLSFVTSLLISQTVERSLNFRGLKPLQVKIYKWLSFSVGFLTLLLLGFTKKTG